MISILKENIRLAVPIFFGQISFTLITFIDNVMISRLGVEELSAFSFSNSIVFLAFALNLGFTMMFTPLISETFTLGNIENTRKLFFHGIIIYSTLGFSLFLILKILENNISVFKQPQEVIDNAKSYLSILTYSFIPGFLFQILKQFSDGLSKTKMPMYCILVSLLLNVVLNYCLIFGKFGFQRYDLLGAGIGVFASRTFLFLIMLFVLLFNSETKVFFKKLSKEKFRINMLQQIVGLGSFSSFQVFFKILLLTTTVILSGRLNTTLQASNQIILNISAIMFSVSFSLGAASAIQSSKLATLKRMDLFRKSLCSMFLLSIFFSTFFLIVLYTLQFKIPYIYTDNFTVIQTVAKTLIILSIFQFLDSLETIILGTFKGLKDTVGPFFITVLPYIFIAIPLSFYFSRKMSIQGIWIGVIVGILISLTALLIRMVTRLNR